MKVKMRIPKRILSLVLALVMVTGLMPISANAASGIENAAVTSNTYIGFTLFATVTNKGQVYCQTCKKLQVVESIEISNGQYSVNWNGSVNVHLLTLDVHYKFSSCGHEFTQTSNTITNFQDCKTSYLTEKVGSYSLGVGKTYFEYIRVPSEHVYAVQEHHQKCIYCKQTNDECVYGDWKEENGVHYRTCIYDGISIQSHAPSMTVVQCEQPTKCSQCDITGETASHVYKYSAEGNTITETCLNRCGHSETAKLEYDTTLPNYVGNDTYTYTGSEIKPLKVTTSSGWKGGTLSISYSADTTNVGAAKGVITKDQITAELEYTITEADIANADVALNPTSGTYTGAPHNDPTYTLTYNGNELTAGTDYTAGAWSGDLLNAGAYTLELTGKGNFTGTKTVTYTIAKAPGTASVTINGWTYGGFPKTPVPTSDTNGTDNVTYLYKKQGAADSTYTSTVPTTAGNYTVKATFPANNSYKEATATADFTIAKQEVAVPNIESRSFSGSQWTADVSDNEYYTVVENDGGTNVGSYDVVLTLKDPENYKWTDSEDAEKTLTFEITRGTNRWSASFPPMDTTWVYGSPSLPEAWCVWGRPKVEYRLADAENGDEAYTETVPTNVGSYLIRFSVAETENYTGLVSVKNLEITKADPAIGTVTAGVVNDTLETSAIVLTRANTTIEGILAVDAGQTLALGDNEIAYTFTPRDTQNYKTVTGKVTVTVQDTIAPTGTVKIATNNWTEFLNTITFGLFFKETQTVSVEAADNLSGVDKIEYASSGEAKTLDAVKAITDWTEYNGSFGVTLEDAKQFVYFVRITDKSGNVAYLSTDGAEYDTTAPVIEGVNNGATYYTTQTVTVTDKNLDTITLNDEAATGSITLEGNKEAAYTIVATDKAGNTTTVTVTMQPISDLTANLDGKTEDNVTSDDASKLQTIVDTATELLEDEDTTAAEKEVLEKAKADAEALIQAIYDAHNAVDTDSINDSLEVTPENVTPEDKTALENAITDLEKALEEYGSNYTEEEQQIIQTVIDRFTDGLKVLENVEAAEGKIEALPETITKSDAAAVKAAQDAYNALTDHEKSLVSAEDKKALDNAVAALAKLNAPQTPATGDDSHIMLWSAMLCVSMLGLVVLLADHKRRKATK